MSFGNNFDSYYPSMGTAIVPHLDMDNFMSYKPQAACEQAHQ